MTITVQDLCNWCIENSVSLDTPIAVRSKDDFFPLDVYMARGYFGNCSEGSAWERENTPIVDGDLDYDSTPEVLILEIPE